VKRRIPSRDTEEERRHDKRVFFLLRKAALQNMLSNYQKASKLN
jgi:hypothetical protein